MKKLILIIILGFTNVYAIEENQGYDKQFEKLIYSIMDQSSAIKANSELADAAKINAVRTERHWLPTLYLTGNSYVTNDPGANMFGLLSQRKIEQLDFTPAKLNEPGSNLFSKAALGINFSLYEGGMREAIKKASLMQFEAKKAESSKTKIEIYSEVSKNYFNLVSLSNQKNEINKIENSLDQIIKSYQIGNKSNMLGYSGILGLKSLKNRIKAINSENETKLTAFSNALNELAVSQNKFQFKNLELKKLLNEYLDTKKNYSTSDKIKTFELNAKAAAEIVSAEKSRNLPRVGLFAEGYGFNGKRNTATGHAAGVYLNWNLFSGNDYGAADEAIHNSHAAKYYAEAMSQKEKIEFESNSLMIDTLDQTLNTLDDSQKLLDEQTNVANNLFKNGMINALQLVEVLSRRVDLINSKAEVEQKLIEAKSKLVTLTNFKSDLIK